MSDSIIRTQEVAYGLFVGTTSATSNDLEGRNDRYFALLSSVRVGQIRQSGCS